MSKTYEAVDSDLVDVPLDIDSVKILSNEALKAATIPPGFFISPCAPMSIPLVMTVVPFDSGVYDKFMNTDDLPSRYARDYATRVLGDEKLKEMLDDAAKIGKDNERIEKWLSSTCLALCCLPCLCVSNKKSEANLNTTVKKWLKEMAPKGPDVEFDVWFRPGNIWLAVQQRNSILAQKNFCFVLKPSEDAILKEATARAAEEAEKAVKEVQEIGSKLSSGMFDLLSYIGVGGAPSSKDVTSPQSDEVKDVTAQSQCNNTELVGNNNGNVASAVDPTTESSQPTITTTAPRKKSWFKQQPKTIPAAEETADKTLVVSSDSSKEQNVVPTIEPTKADAKLMPGLDVKRTPEMSCYCLPRE